MLPAITPRDKVLLPLAVLAEVQKEKAEKEQALARAEREHQLAEAVVARAETFTLEYAERDSKSVEKGRGEVVTCTTTITDSIGLAIDSIRRVATNIS